MDYTLAKELYDAGFPQGGNGSWLSDPNAIVVRAGARMYVPTLTELIDMCADDIEAVVQHHSATGNTWAATGFYRHVQGEGGTPLEAVARLWLALNTPHRDPL